MKTPIFTGDHTRTRFVRLETKSCQACWNCITACLNEVIGKIEFLGHRHARLVNPSQCTGCLKCVSVCGHGAMQALAQHTGDDTMDTIVEKKPFNKRAFISIALLVSGLALPFSGFMNHSLQFAPLTAERHFWMSVHNMSAILFSISCVLHVSLNGRALIHYAKKAGGMLLSKEALAAISIVLLLVGIVSSHAFHVQ